MTINRERFIWWHAAALAAACLVMFWLGLSWRSFASSEGHRVAPAWAMLDSGNWWRISMFEQAYLRKPPGMPWAIAAASSLLGRGEFAARSVSAISMTLGALAAWWFASRWFGPRLGIAAGLGLIVMPQLWAPARSAEIEALNNFGTLLAALAILDRVAAGPPRTNGAPPAPPDRTRADSVLVILLGAAGMIIAVLAKGPAGAPVLAGVLVAPAILRLWTARAYAQVAVMGLIAAGVLIPVGRRVVAATLGVPGADGDAITQGADEFLWSGGWRGAGKVLALAPLSFLAAMPTSLALAFVIGRRSRAEAQEAGPGAALSLRMARLLALSWLIALAAMCLFGVSNHRYALPAAGLLAPIACHVVAAAWSKRPWLSPDRLRLARALMLGRPLALPALLLSAALLNNLVPLVWQRGIDGREAGRTIASMLPDPVDLWADGLIEARPDVLLYAREDAGARGVKIRPLWKKRSIAAGELPPPGAAIVLRTDAQSGERLRYDPAIRDGTLVAVGDGRVGRYEFTVYRSAAR